MDLESNALSHSPSIYSFRSPTESFEQLANRFFYNLPTTNRRDED